ncbi:hypothetical protein BB558_000129 [Smittium angustum]|uniref:RNA-binding S4 domain-containing protein n=1 Tax=Smittium angustum TaxID=133377 RepID=A0A2U1JFA1_SMIAN|nr:hypothetical protein BB558_003252 [Smittium angustum]PWA03715.1 hypothetical protein BB558_000129 [Smittium angustum]
MTIQNSHRLKLTKGLVRLSWNRFNLFFLASKRKNDLATTGPNARRRTAFQQQWLAKSETRAYHDADITEKQIHRIIPRNLPTAGFDSRINSSALLYANLERRIDFIVFRSHFASSIWQARRMILQGHVSLNGKKFMYPSHQVSDGDLITVNPKAICTLKAKEKTKQNIESSESEQVKDTLDLNDASKIIQQPIQEKSSASAANRLVGGKIASALNTEYEFAPRPYQQPFMFLPEYLEVNYNTCSTVFLRNPTINKSLCELPSPFPPELHALAFLYYSRRGKTSY